MGEDIKSTCKFYGMRCGAVKKANTSPPLNYVNHEQNLMTLEWNWILHGWILEVWDEGLDIPTHSLGRRSATYSHHTTLEKYTNQIHISLL